jgi:predicted HTH transcriptional regulator
MPETRWPGLVEVDTKAWKAGSLVAPDRTGFAGMTQEKTSLRIIARHIETMLNYRANLKELDSKKIRSFLATKKNQSKAKYSEALLEAYSLTGQEHAKKYITNAGILLFGKRPQHFISEAMIICTHFRGVLGRDVVATVDCEGTLFDQFETAFAYLLQRLTRSFIIEGAKREETYKIRQMLKEPMDRQATWLTIKVKLPTCKKRWLS